VSLNRMDNDDEEPAAWNIILLDEEPVAWNIILLVVVFHCYLSATLEFSPVLVRTNNL
jgi:hypothetical protein